MTVTNPAPAGLAASRPGLKDDQHGPGNCDSEAVEVGTHSPAVSGSAPAQAAVALIQLYQLARTGRTSPCRFLPTCSQYAAEAIERHGLRRGLRLALSRLGRCRPGGPFGSDPVPE